MAKHLVFLVHGMGQHYNRDNQPGSTGWADAGIAALKKGSGKLSYPGSFDNDYEFIPISYSGIFDDYLAAHAAEAEKFYSNPTQALIKKITPEYPLIGALMKIAKTKPQTKKFMISHFGDVAFYAATHLGGQVRELVKNGILKGIADHGAKSSWSIVAHSLGTRVVHDTLQNIYAKEDNYAVYGRPNLLMNVGNVVELMHPSDADSLYKNTRVFPSGKAKTGSCYYYINACHPLDPFTWLRHFDPLSYWGGGQTDDRYIDVQIRPSHVTQLNTHGFDHYLSHPRVQAVFFTGTHKMSPAYPIGENKISKAITLYEAETVTGKLQEFKTEVEKLKMTELNQWDQLADRLVRYYKLIEKVNK